MKKHSYNPLPELLVVLAGSALMGAMLLITLHVFEIIDIHKLF